MSSRLVEQNLTLFQIERVEAFGEPAMERSEKIAGFRALALVAPQDWARPIPWSQPSMSKFSPWALSAAVFAKG
jgi:hypothetical protein